MFSRIHFHLCHFYKYFCAKIICSSLFSKIPSTKVGLSILVPCMTWPRSTMYVSSTSMQCTVFLLNYMYFENYSVFLGEGTSSRRHTKGSKVECCCSRCIFHGNPLSKSIQLTILPKLKQKC